MLKQETIHYDQDGYDVSITVTRATVRVGINRSRLLQREEEHIGEGADVMARWCWQAYADCMAATVDVDNAQGAKERFEWNGDTWPNPPFPFEQFMNLPEPLVYDWRDAILTLNPHWAPWRQARGAETGDDQPGEAGGGEE